MTDTRSCKPLISLAWMSLVEGMRVNHVAMRILPSRMNSTGWGGRFPHERAAGPGGKNQRSIRGRPFPPRHHPKTTGNFWIFIF